MTARLGQRLLAELFGALALVLAGCGAVVVEAQSGALGHLGVALTFGLVVTVMVASVGHVSGAHINPAVTVAFALLRHFPWREVPGYVAAQIAGAVAGAGTLMLLFGAQPGRRSIEARGSRRARAVSGGPGQEGGFGR